MKKFSIIILAMILCLSVMMGCGNNEPDGQVNDAINKLNSELLNHNQANLIQKETINENGMRIYSYQSDLSLEESNTKGIGITFQYNENTKQFSELMLVGMKQKEAYNAVKNVIYNLSLLQLSQEEKDIFQDELTKGPAQKDIAGNDTNIFYVNNYEVVETFNDQLNTSSLIIRTNHLNKN